MNIESFSTDPTIALYKLSSNSLTCYVTNYGARVVSLLVEDQYENPIDVVLGFSTLEAYKLASEQYHGATIGRYANRIANGRFRIQDKEYSLETNNGPNSLHGGVEGFHLQTWRMVEKTTSTITMEYKSPDMEEGFPGTLTLRVIYQVVGSDLRISYSARTTDTTVLNPTHHSYFNLNGEATGSVLDHMLRINAEYYTPVNEAVIPTGSIDLVTGTAFDFQTSKRLGKEIDNEDLQLRIAKGYDHNFVVSHYEYGRLNYIATVKGEKSLVQMEVWSTEPGVQLYTGNHLASADIGKTGVSYGPRDAFCLETQHFPDSPNQKGFPSTVLAPEDVFESMTEYRFENIGK